MIFEILKLAKIKLMGSEKVRLSPVGSEKVRSSPVGSEKVRLSPVGSEKVKRKFKYCYKREPALVIYKPNITNSHLAHFIYFDYYFSQSGCKAFYSSYTIAKGQNTLCSY